MSDTSLPLGKPLTALVGDNWGFTNTEIIKFSYMWTITHFSFCGANAGDILMSPTFSTGENGKFKWLLKAYPKGDAEETKDHLSIYLSLVSDHRDGVIIQFKFSILNTNREETNQKTSSVRRFTEDDCWGYSEYIRQDVLLNKANKLLTDDNLTLCCEISIVANSFNISGQNNYQSFKIPECALPNDMEQLFESQRFCDFIFSVNGQEFFVHKNILSSRSSVFAAMFENEMEEKKKNRVEITDVDPKVMKEMLRFVYTGKAPCAKKMARDLFVVADKYDLDRLKVMCEESLRANLSVKTASNVLILADLHNSNLLKTRTIDFIILHATAVMATSGWKTLAMQHPHLVEEVLRDLTSQQTQQLSSADYYCSIL